MSISTLVRPREFTTAKEVMANVRATNEWRKRLGTQITIPPIVANIQQPITLNNLSIPQYFPSISGQSSAHFQQEYHIGKEPEPIKIPSIRQIQAAVCRYTRVSYVDLISHRRDKRVCEPRQIAMLLAKLLTARSFPEVGRLFGMRDHTTVLHAFRKYQFITDELRNTGAITLPLVNLVAYAFEIRDRTK